MKKSKLKRLLEYCPKPSEPFIKILKRYSVPAVITISVSILLISFFFLAQTALSQSALLPPPPFTTRDYNPGVSVGDYVIYGNFECKREHPEGAICIGDLAFKKIEVISVIGKEVTFLHTQQYKNGTATWLDGRTETWDVEKAQWSEDTDVWTDSCLILAANLTEGDCIQLEPAPLSSFYVAKTGVLTYLGVDRNVSILHYQDRLDNNGELCEITAEVVYDQESGIRLESALVTLDGDLVASMSVVETNIFSASDSQLPSLQDSIAGAISTVAFCTTTGPAFVVIFVLTKGQPRKRLRGGEINTEK